MIRVRAEARRKQQDEYQRAIEQRRAEEEEQMAKTSPEHDQNEESVLYNPVTLQKPPEATENFSRLKAQDDDKEFKREARARRIYHNSNSGEYDPITGLKRTFW